MYKMAKFIEKNDPTDRLNSAQLADVCVLLEKAHVVGPKKNKLKQQSMEVSPTFSLSEHNAISHEVSVPMTKPKPTDERCLIFECAEHESVKEYLNHQRFRPECCQNVDRLYDDFKMYCNNIIGKKIPLKLKTSTNPPECFFPDTSNNLKRLQTQRKIHSSEPTSHRKSKILESKKMLVD